MKLFLEWPNQKTMKKVGRKVEEFLFWKTIYGKYLCLIKMF